MADFNRAVKYVIDNEGGFVNHPEDAGGPTKYGVTQKTLESWRKLNYLPSLNVEEITESEAAKIYYEWYWRKMDLDQVVSDVIATALLDTGVIRGTTKAIEYAQVVLNTYIPLEYTEKRNAPVQPVGLDVDGIAGEEFFRRINHPQTTDESFIRKLEEKLRHGYIQIAHDKPNQKVFLQGWLNRTRELLTLIGDKV